MAYNSFLTRWQQENPITLAPEPAAENRAIIIDSKQEKRSITLADPRFWAYFGLGSQNLANVDVNINTSLSVPPFFCAVRYISEGVAMLDRKVRTRTPQGIKDAEAHPLWDFFLGPRPHPYYTWSQFICALLTNACIGNGYARIHWDYMGMRPMYLEHIPNIFCKPDFDHTGRLWYVITGNINGSAISERVPPTEIIHIKGLSIDGILGYDTTVMHEKTLATGISRQVYENSVMGKQARPSIAIQQQEPLESAAEAATIEENIMRRMGGADNAGRPLVLDAGQTVQYLQWSPLEAALDKLSALNVEDVARITKVPRDLLALDTHGTYGAGVQRSKDFLLHCLLPWIEQIQEEFCSKLFWETESRGARTFFEFDTSMYVGLDKEAQSKILVAEVAGSIRTPNEARQALGLPAVADGDEIMVDINLLPMSKAVEIALAKYLSAQGEKFRGQQQQSETAAAQGDNKPDNENATEAKPKPQA